MRRTLRALPLLALAASLSCSRPSSNQDVGQALGEFEAAIETEDIAKLGGCIAPDYADAVGKDRAALLNLFQSWFEEYEAIQIARGKTTTGAPDSTGTVTVSFNAIVRANSAQEDASFMSPAQVNLTLCPHQGKLRICRAQVNGLRLHQYDPESDLLAPLNLTPDQQEKVGSWLADEARPKPAELAEFLRTILTREQRSILDAMMSSPTGRP